MLSFHILKDTGGLLPGQNIRYSMDARERGDRGQAPLAVASLEAFIPSMPRRALGRIWNVWLQSLLPPWMRATSGCVQSARAGSYSE
eukprot:3159222-Amphidinium_carterae.1